jgi:hypothetical protein
MNCLNADNFYLNTLKTRKKFQSRVGEVHIR